MCEDCYRQAGMCQYEGHNYGRNPRNANCLDCGELNGPLLSYIGHVAKVQKRNGLTFREAERFMAQRAAAIELVRGTLYARLTWAGIDEEDL